MLLPFKLSFLARFVVVNDKVLPLSHSASISIHGFCEDFPTVSHCVGSSAAPLSTSLEIESSTDSNVA